MPDSAISVSGSSTSLTLPTPNTLSSSARAQLPPLPPNLTGYRGRAHSTIGLEFDFNPKFDLGSGLDSSAKSRSQDINRLSFSVTSQSGNSTTGLGLGLGLKTSKREWDDIIGTMREKDKDGDWRRQSTSVIEGSGTRRGGLTSEFGFGASSRRDQSYNPYSPLGGRYTPSGGPGKTELVSPREGHFSRTMGTESNRGGRETDDGGREKEKERDRDGDGPVGIAALVSAAEERSRERAEAVA